MRGNLDLPVGDRDEVDDAPIKKPIVPELEPEVPSNVTPPEKGEGLGSWLLRIEEELSEDEARQDVIDAGGF
jgi:hypothetical protein